MARRIDSQLEPLTMPVPATPAGAVHEPPIHPATWLAFNALCAAGVVLPALSANSPGVLLGWLVCLTLNLVGACSVLRWLVPTAGAPLSQALAAVLGVVWGVGVGLVGAPLALPALFTALLAATAAVGATVPMMAVAAPSWLALLAGFFAPTTWLLASRDVGLAAVWGGLILPLFILFARRQQHLAADLAALRSGLAHLHGQARDAGIAVVVDPHARDAERARLAALAQCIDDNAHAATTLAALPEAVLRVDRDGRVVFLNGAAQSLTGLRLASALGRPVQEVLDLIATDEDKLTAHLIEQCFSTGMTQHSPSRAWLRRENDAVRAIECKVAPVHDVQRRIDGLVFTLRDVTAAFEDGQLVTWCATHDGLTSLPDRSCFDAQISTLLAAAEPEAPRCHALLVIDVDGFGELNELYGLPAGDRVLRELASVLREEVTPPDLLARTGEDEFGVCLEDCTLERARQIADTLRVAIADHRIQWQHATISVQASIGVVELAGHGASQVAALTRATRACALAKRAGGNRVRVLGDDEHWRADGTSPYVTLDPRVLRNALERDRIAFGLAPVRPLDERAVQPGYAELVLQLAGDTIRLAGNIRAAQARLAAELDRRRVAAAIGGLRASHPSLAAYDIVALDVSATSLTDGSYTEYVLGLLTGGATIAHRLCFEVAASMPADCVERCAEFVSAVRELGCHVTLDGFGGGGQSFQLLKRLRPDYVKIDDDFVRRLGASSVDYEIVLGMTRVARTMNVKIIADGVGTMAARELLCRMGVDFIQGPLAGPTRPVAVTAA